MLKKTYAKNGKTCRVTFRFPAQVDVQQVQLCGDFTDWEDNPLVMKRLKDGSFSRTVSLQTEREYHYRYLLDGTHWENDWAADAYTSNPFGAENSVVQV
jgi:1,4-alpha-glucan branching enzyme